ncbi:GNAT family N-acetyltransferase [Virgibacillus sp. AGTR]|uniref:GNAT family N-acetyltransferase n=1 Tax=unclassified Virgibacillus TaxID=2620237 RepID=UPI0019656980|nr:MULTISPECIES: GNAT family N-acetyltransferase [unclassified Virgibacillus]MCC2251618.1 GNAT family N-acetyltransferase [Virgibacillus sp. AGTR]MDY7045915.1 GNAT family N-acetyltransferase [Virgibacillus sp. M23]QRZ19628.1 GNAT family N-acetyltransferase [Virgibacillus sp. AGTR]
MHWLKRTFHELTNDELYQILKARTDIFVVEQACAYPELDNYDQHCVHYCLKTDEGKVIAYARVLPAGSKYAETSIGRVLVVEAYRGKGYGNELMEYIIGALEEEKTKIIKIQAQLYLKAFYESFKFKQISSPYLEDGIWHIDMIWANDY